MSKDKPVARDKKKGSNGNSVPGSGGENGTSNVGNGNDAIKSEPMERERERVEEEVKEEPPAVSEEPQTSDPSDENPPSDLKPPDLALPDAKVEESQLLDNPVSCKSLKTEDGANNEPDFGTDGCDGVLPLGLSLPQDGVQPLASNVINKQPATMEAQYMQQQSQIFVFSTALANKSAESVLQGQFPSIIAYHCSQPRTKKFLEKHPLKMTQFNRQNPAQWLNNLNQFKQKNAPGSIKCQGMGRGGIKNNLIMDVGLGMGNRMPLWNQGNNMGGNGGAGPQAMGQMKPEPPNMMPTSPGMMSSLSDFGDDSLNLGPHHSLAGVKVPDENLTPQQRQHREEQLATLRKMQQMLFPEQHSPGSGDNTPADLEHVMPDAADLMLGHKPVSQADWQKLQMQFYDDRKKRPNNPGGQNNNGRGQGPPPPYHQATRSASVPVAVASPNPGSPGNNTSNLSLPSPRACSGLNSPAESKARHAPGPSPTSVDSPGPPRCSNPGTPVSSTHLSPKKEKPNGNNTVVGEFSPTSNMSAPTNQQSPVDTLFCRSLQSLAQQKQSSNSTPTSKEPNLMPVPSPQQIQYLNTFEGQELTIQKQPNTSLKDTNIMSPSLPQKSVEGVMPGATSDMGNKVSGRTTPLTPGAMELNVSRYPGTSTPGEFTPSPQPAPEKQGRPTPSDQRFCPSPQLNDSIATSRFNMISSSPVVSNSFMQQQPPQQQQQPSQQQKGPHFIDIPSPNKACVGEGIKDPNGGGYPCIGPDNIPLNPNGMARISVGNGNKVSHFDPITSLAQMSQQLTNNVGGSPVNPPGGMMGPSPGMHPGMMPFNPSGPGNMHMMSMNDMNVCAGPGPDMGNPGVGVRLGNPQMATLPHAFSPGAVGNGAGVGRLPCPSVSPKPNMMTGGYNGPGPRLVSRAPVPNSYNGANIQVKPSAPNTIQYLPTRPQPGSAAPRAPPSLEFLQRFSNPLSNLDSKVPTHNLQYFPNNYQQNNPTGGEMLGNMNCGGMVPGPGNVVMRAALRGGSGGMMRVGVPNMSGFGGNDQMFTSPGGSGCQMFVPGPKGMSGMAPDASQPLPPSMGQANNFKNSSFIGPTTADPNYAQQFHNFQQQLYATNTRSQLSNQAMAANQQFFVPK